MVTIESVIMNSPMNRKRRSSVMDDDSIKPLPNTNKKPRRGRNGRESVEDAIEKWKKVYTNQLDSGEEVGLKKVSKVPAKGSKKGCMQEEPKSSELHMGEESKGCLDKSKSVEEKHDCSLVHVKEEAESIAEDKPRETKEPNDCKPYEQQHESEVETLKGAVDDELAQLIRIHNTNGSNDINDYLDNELDDFYDYNNTQRPFKRKQVESEAGLPQNFISNAYNDFDFRHNYLDYEDQDAGISILDLEPYNTDDIKVEMPTTRENWNGELAGSIEPIGIAAYDYDKLQSELRDGNFSSDIHLYPSSEMKAEAPIVREEPGGFTYSDSYKGFDNIYDHMPHEPTDFNSQQQIDTTNTSCGGYDLNSFKDKFDPRHTWPAEAIADGKPSALIRNENCLQIPPENYDQFQLPSTSYPGKGGLQEPEAKLQGGLNQHETGTGVDYNKLVYLRPDVDLDLVDAMKFTDLWSPEHGI
ncbi:hypothetical protein CCACVL1_10526 [Corchorus capsularis]|uniref:Uncharacterized protein n=1 Tax=Corchorus capsularis TaxID=210143 RepID=A0A1R3IQU7_COCAP|nr:hypothetical protein CCACVL1_10526 [Corchorus capsularis]